MRNLTRRIEKLERRTGLEQGPALVVVVMPAGTEPSPLGQRKIEEAEACLRQQGGCCTGVVLDGADCQPELRPAAGQKPLLSSRPGCSQ